MRETILAEMRRLKVVFMESRGKEEDAIRQWIAQPTPMPTELRRQWIDGLRSGRYAQGTGYLRTNTGYCCLGVLCDVKGVAWEEGHKRYAVGFMMPMSAWEPEEYMKWETTVLPDPLRKEMNLTDSQQVMLTQLNDHGFTFKLIADVLELVTYPEE